MKKEKGKKNVEKQVQPTREELLGYGSEAFSLNQAEYVSKKIIDQILFHVYETIRIHNVYPPLLSAMYFFYLAAWAFVDCQLFSAARVFRPAHINTESKRKWQVMTRIFIMIFLILFSHRPSPAVPVKNP